MLLNNQRTYKELTGLLGFDCQALEIRQETNVCCWELDAVRGLDAETSAWALKDGQAWRSKGDGLSKDT